VGVGVGVGSGVGVGVGVGSGVGVGVGWGLATGASGEGSTGVGWEDSGSHVAPVKPGPHWQLFSLLTQIKRTRFLGTVALTVAVAHSWA